MRTSTNGIKTGDKFIVTILSVIVFIICAFNIPGRLGPTVWQDELAQLAIGAYFIGYNWSGVISVLGGYFSYGNAILRLPIFILANSPSTIYTLILVQNAFLAACLVPLSYALCKRWGLTSLRNNPIYIPVILFTTLSAAVITYTVIGWAEVALVVVAYATTLCFYKIQDRDCKYYWFVIQSFLLMFGYVIHQRFLGVLIAGVFVVLLMTLFQKINFKKTIVFFITTLILIGIHLVVKDNIQTNLWLLNEYSPPIGNDFEAVFNRSIRIVTESRFFFSTIRVAVGHLLYLGIASFMLVYFAMHKLIKNNVMFVIKGKEHRRDFDYTLIFILIAFLLTYAISVIFLHGASSRADVLIYGRYNVILYSVLCLYILVEIIKGNYKFTKFTYIIIALFLIMTVWTDINYRYHFSGLFHADINTTSFTIFRYISEDYAFYLAFGVSSVIGISILLAKKWNMKKLLNYTTGVVLFLSIIISIFSAQLVINAWNGFYERRISDAAHAITQKTEDINMPVYYLRLPESRRIHVYEAFLQYRLFNRTLNLVYSTEEITHSNYYLILSTSSLAPINSNSHTTLINSNELFFLFKVDIRKLDTTYIEDDVRIITISNEYGLRINNEYSFEDGFMWTGSEATFLFSFTADDDYIFRINLATNIPHEVGILNAEFKINQYGNIVYNSIIDSETMYIEFPVSKEMLSGRHHILSMTIDTWSPDNIFGNGDTRNLGIPITSVEAISATFAFD